MIADMKIPFDANSANIDSVREIVLERLRAERGNWSQFDPTGDGFRDYAVLEGNAHRALLFHSQQIYVELMVQEMCIRDRPPATGMTSRWMITSLDFEDIHA